jgi:hypothetical protein
MTTGALCSASQKSVKDTVWLSKEVSGMENWFRDVQSNRMESVTLLAEVSDREPERVPGAEAFVDRPDVMPAITSPTATSTFTIPATP